MSVNTIWSWKPLSSGKPSRNSRCWQWKKVNLSKVQLWLDNFYSINPDLLLLLTEGSGIWSNPLNRQSIFIRPTSTGWTVTLCTISKAPFLPLAVLSIVTYCTVTVVHFAPGYVYLGECKSARATRVTKSKMTQSNSSRCGSDCSGRAQSEFSKVWVQTGDAMYCAQRV